MPAIDVDTIPGIANLDNTGHACIQTGGCGVLNGNLFHSYGMEYKKCTDITWCQYPSPLTCGSLSVGVTCYNVTIPDLDTNTCYQYHAIACRTYAVSGTTLSIHTPINYPWITATPLHPGPVPLYGTCYNYNITGLTANTIYQYRSYMIVCGVEYFGKDCYQAATCATPVFAPTVSTCAITGIGQTSATGSGLVSSDGGSPVTARGTAWKTGPNPTISDCHTVDGSGTGTFYSSITPLVPNTTYYVRAYATNVNGISYGNQCSLITLPIPPPTITETYNQGIPGSVRYQYFEVGGTILAGDIFTLTVYSHSVSVTAVVGDGPLSIVNKLIVAINATTAAQWNDHGSAPAPGTPGFKPTANLAILGAIIVLTLNYQNQFGASAYRP